ncbi:MAG: DEAD/DEAH box helicase [Candidatus Micrarchaeia archaeon]
MKFEEMNLNKKLTESLKTMGFDTATEVQEKVIPYVLEGKSVVVRAKTGTGKTATFIVPIMQMLEHSRAVEAIVIAPTRELAIQISNFSKKLGRPLNFYTTTVYGGASINVQVQELREMPNIVVGTPGRILDLIKRGALRLDKIKYVVLDEADVMLDMGFIDDIEEIIANMPSEKQLMLFSATMPREITKIAERYLRDPQNIQRVIIGSEEDISVSTIKHYYTIVPSKLKYSALLAYINEYKPKKAIIFTRTKSEADTLYRFLQSNNYNSILLHGGLTQAMRERSLGNFRVNAQFLVATNIAARGLDIEGITDIINFGLPEEPNVYVHRVGRSARMGKEGRAMIIADTSERREILGIEYYAHISITNINLNLEPFLNVKVPVFDYNHRNHYGNQQYRNQQHRNSNYRRDYNRSGYRNYRRSSRRN